MSRLIPWLTLRSKYFVAAITALAIWIGQVILSVSAPITAGEWYALLLAELAALGVYVVPNYSPKGGK